MVLSPAQSRAARAMLLWSQERLAKAAGVAKGTVLDFERGIRRPISHNRQALRRTFEDAGISFINEGEGGGRGIRFTRPGDDPIAADNAGDADGAG